LRELEGKYQDAHATLDSVEGMLTEALTIAKIRYLLERGRVYNSSGEPDKSKPLFLEAWELARTNNEDYYAVDAAHMLGIVELPEKQLEWSLKALELAEKTTEERAQRWLGPLYNNIGWTYYDLEEYEEALELFKKGLAWRKEMDDVRGIRIQTWNIARTYRSLGKVKEALEMQRALEKEIEGIEFDFEGYVFEEIAECMLLLEKQEEAKPYFKRAYEILSKDQWLVKNEPERLERLKDLSE
jgi:tetratricopeptide (TPR) repeat protein